MLGGTGVGTGVGSTHTQPGFAQSSGATGAFGQQGCEAEVVTDIEAQAPIGFKTRKATARIASTSFALAFMNALPLMFKARLQPRTLCRELLLK
jgi:hypothetical protein